MENIKKDSVQLPDGEGTMVFFKYVIGLYLNT